MPIMASDTISQAYPFTKFIVDYFIRFGHLPHWNPYLLLGYPILDGGGLTLGLNRLIFFIFPVQHIFSYEFFFYCFLGGIFTYFLLLQRGFSKLTSFLFGLGFIFIPANVSYISVGHLKIIITALVPGVLLFVDLGFKYRKIIFFALAGLLLGIQAQIHPQLFYYFIIFFLFYYGIMVFAEYKKKKEDILKELIYFGLILGFMGLIAILVASPMTILMQNYSKYTSRSGAEGSGWVFATSWSQSPGELIELFFPKIYGMAGGNYFGPRPFIETTHYFGIVFAILALLGLADRWRTAEAKLFSGFAFFAMLFSLGSYFEPFYRILYNLLWGINKFRNPPTIFLLFPGLFLIYAAYGLEFLLNLKDKIKIPNAGEKIVASVVLGAVILILIVTLSVFNSDGYNSQIEQKIFSRYGRNVPTSEQIQPQVAAKRKIARNSIFLGIFIIFLCGIGLFLYYSNFLNRYVLIAGIFIIVISEFWILDQNFIRSIPDYSQVSGKTDAIRFLQGQQLSGSSRFRILPVPVSIDNESNKWQLFGIESAFGYHALSLSRYDKVFVKPDKRYNLLASPKFMGLANIKYFLAKGIMKIPGFTEVFRSRRKLIYENEFHLPRYFTVNDYRVMETEEDILAFLNNRESDFKKEIILEEKPENEPDPNGRNVKPGSNVIVEEFTTDRIVLNVTAYSDTFLFSSEMYFPRWRASVDGKKTKIYQADYLFRAVFLPAGKHQVVFEYSFSWLYYLVMALVNITLLAVLIPAVYLGIKHRKLLEERYVEAGE